MNSFNLHRRSLLIAAAAGLPFGRLAIAADPPPTLALIGFELIDEQNDTSRAVENARHLALAQRLLTEQLQQRGLYRMLDLAPAQAEIERVRAEQAWVYQCNGCLVEIGAKLGTRLVAVGWVQKVSNLILNINLEIRDVSTDRVVLTKSVDLRGNTDETWTRAVAFMVRDMAERRERNPRYGI
jgi:Protein of unknown function (DUF2380)